VSRARKPQFEADAKNRQARDRHGSGVHEACYEGDCRSGGGRITRVRWRHLAITGARATGIFQAICAFCHNPQ